MFNTFNRLRGKSGSAPPASAAEAAQAGAAAGGDVEAGKGGEVEHKGDALHFHGASFQSGTAKRPLEVRPSLCGLVLRWGLYQCCDRDQVLVLVQADSISGRLVDVPLCQY